MIKIRNLGPVSMEWLREIDIHTLEQLQEYGALAVFTMVREQRPDVSLNLLWALEGAVQGADWRDVTPARKHELLADLEAVEWEAEATEESQ